MTAGDVYAWVQGEIYMHCTLDMPVVTNVESCTKFNDLLAKIRL